MNKPELHHNMLTVSDTRLLFVAIPVAHELKRMGIDPVKAIEALPDIVVYLEQQAVTRDWSPAAAGVAAGILSAIKMEESKND